MFLDKSSILRVVDSEWDENARYGALGAFKVPELVVEEDVGAKGLKDAPLVKAVHEKEFCRAHAEASQRGDEPLLACRAPGGHDGDPDGRLEVGIPFAALLPVKPLEEGELREEVA